MSAVEIVNIRNGLGDDRYGDAEDFHEVIYTGTKHEFSAGELTTVQVGTSTPIDVTVWGGDCYVGLMQYKVNNTTYAIVDSNESLNAADAETYWGNSFRVSSSEVQRPVPLAGNSQMVTVYIESEVNPDVRSIELDYRYQDAGYSFPANNPDNQGSVRMPLTYAYHPGFTQGNTQKVYVPFDSFESNTNKFKSRLLYSDVKIYQSSEEGFDTYRVGNHYDLDETYGELNKLIRVNDYLHGIQKNALVYVPIQAQIIETDDVSQLAVRSADVVGRPKYYDVLHGTTQPKTVQPFNNGYFMYDDLNHQVLKVTALEVKDISPGIITDLNGIQPTEERAMVGNYNPNNQKYSLLLSDTDAEVYDGWVWNDRLGVWETSLSFPTNSATLYMVNIGDKEYHVIVSYGNPYDIDIVEAYAGTYTEWNGTAVTPELQLIVNPDNEFAKKFDNIRYQATKPLNTADFTVPQRGSASDLSDTSVDISSDKRETYYRVKVLRNTGDNQRLVGPYMQVDIDFDTSEGQVTLFDWITKYRPSPRVI